jgi:hypothetical protein
MCFSVRQSAPHGDPDGVRGSVGDGDGGKNPPIRISGTGRGHDFGGRGGEGGAVPRPRPAPLPSLVTTGGGVLEARYGSAED